jgi:hypothetical protein
MKEGIHVASNWTICVVWWAVSTLPIHNKHVQFALVSFFLMQQFRMPNSLMGPKPPEKKKLLKELFT